ncbi:MAG TPA: DUF1559 domain-containing protein [Pirellulales bacterium]|jgi:hypothetical protein|nr:DUF1559 domain-containing protein [Pirellulales bacterium]
MRFIFNATVIATLLLSAGAVSGQDTFDPSNRVKIIAPLIDEQTLAVAHLDLTRVAVDPLFDQAVSLQLVSTEEATVMKIAAGAVRQRLIGAGVKEVYAFFTLSGGLRQAKPFAAIPLDAASDEKAIRGIVGMVAATERRGDLLLIAPDRDTLARLVGMTADSRPELAPALEAAGDTAAQVLLLPPKHYRRVLEEAVGELPKEIGGGPINVITRGVLWAAAGIDAPPHAALRLTIQAEDAHAAEALRSKLGDLLRLAGENGGTRKVVPNYDEVAALMLPRLEGNRLVLVLDDKNRGIDTVLASLARPIESLQRRSAMVKSINNLKQIALAMHGYHSTHKHFPLPASVSPQGTPLLSWRVAILPFIDERPLYQQFHLDEAWDSPHNRALIDKMPEIYRLPVSKNKEPGRTNYLLPVGNGAAFTTDKPTEFKDISDGTSNTIMVVESDDDHAAIWTKPDDWQFDPQQPTQGLGRFYSGGFYAALFDGSVRLVPGTIDPKTLKALVTRAGGEVIESF